MEHIYFWKVILAAVRQISQGHGLSYILVFVKDNVERNLLLMQRLYEKEG